MKFLAMLILLFKTTNAAQAFDWNIHRSLTIKTLTAQGFSSKAAKQIAEANIQVDQNEANNPATHFDNEAFEAGSKLIRTRLTSAAQAIVREDMIEARVIFGYITHSIQDFYAHSTYVELMDRKNIDVFNLRNPPPGTICNKKNLSTDLTSGYFPDSSTPKNKCSHSFLNKDSGNFTLKGAKATEYAALETQKAYTRLYDEVMSLTKDSELTRRLMASFRDSDLDLQNSNNNFDYNYIYHQGKYRFIPHVGYVRLLGIGLNQDPVYSYGLKIETTLSDVMVTGVDFNTTKIILSTPSESYESVGNKFNLYTKLYLINDSKFQPYIGAGARYSNNVIKGVTSVVSNNLSAHLFGGTNIMFTNNLGLSLEGKFLKNVLTGGDTTIYSQRPSEYELEKVKNKMKKSSQLDLSLGLLISF